MTSNELFKIEMFVSDILRGVRHEEVDLREAAYHLQFLLKLLKEKYEEIHEFNITLREMEDEFRSANYKAEEDLQNEVNREVELQEKISTIDFILRSSKEEYFKTSPDIQKIKELL